DIAREYLLAEGLPADRVIKTGSPMYEVLQDKMKDIQSADSYKKLELEKDNYFVVSAHREENIESDKNFYDLVESLNAVAEEYQMPIIVSTHPRTRKRIENLNIEFNEYIQLMKPMGFTEYNNLQVNAKAVLRDRKSVV